MRKDEWKMRVPKEIEEKICEYMAYKEVDDFYLDFTPTSNEAILHLYNERIALEIIEKFSFQYEKVQFDDADWIEIWRKGLRLFEIEKGFYVNPDPERIESPRDGITVVVKPGMAFGTGEHETTRLAAKLLIRAMEENNFSTVCDIGCGSGVLSALACKLGAKSVLALDVDEKALEQAMETAKINCVSYEVRKSDLLNNVREKFELYVANIVYDVLKTLLKEIPQNSTFIASGVDRGRAEKFRKLCKHSRFKIIEERREGEWHAFLVKT